MNMETVDLTDTGIDIKLHNENCEVGLSRIADESVDCILTDPPYQYLKHKLDIPFDEEVVFSHFKRILKPTGFVVMFGRGTAFYRWNTMLADLGFEFKEEVIWNKRRNSSPLTRMSRVHEIISIFAKQDGIINKVKVPYLETKRHDLDSIIADVKRMRTILSNQKDLMAVEKFLSGGDIYNSKGNLKHGITKSKETKSPNVCAGIMKMMSDGMTEKSIIEQGIDRHKYIHPTQKPVRLLERLLALTTIEGDVVVDPFSGSGATAIACHKMYRKFEGFEIDKEYFSSSVERIKKECNPGLFD